MAVLLFQDIHVTTRTNLLLKKKAIDSNIDRELKRNEPDTIYMLTELTRQSKIIVQLSQLQRTLIPS